MADDLSASKLFGYASRSPRARTGSGSDKLIAYVIQKASGEHRVGAGKLVGHAVLSSGIVLAWRHGDDLGIL
jgi:hypothetical protein